MTWQHALRLLSQEFTWKGVAAKVGVTHHAVQMWWGFMQGHAWGWQPDQLRKAKLIRLATELVLRGTPRQRRRDGDGRRTRWIED